MGKRRFRPGYDIPTRYKPKTFLDRIVETKIKGHSDPMDDIKPSKRLHLSRKLKIKNLPRPIVHPKPELIEDIKTKIKNKIIITRKDLEKEKQRMCLERKWPFPKTQTILKEIGPQLSSQVKRKRLG